jgi:hypothetical protein
MKNTVQSWSVNRRASRPFNCFTSTGVALTPVREERIESRLIVESDIERKIISRIADDDAGL